MTNRELAVSAYLRWEACVEPRVSAGGCIHATSALSSRFPGWSRQQRNMWTLTLARLACGECCEVEKTVGFRVCSRPEACHICGRSLGRWPRGRTCTLCYGRCLKSIERGIGKRKRRERKWFRKGKKTLTEIRRFLRAQHRAASHTP